VAQFAVSHDVICTFHSVERKTGRSMALANVAELLRRRGQRILVVDWDLENPGLDYFFPDPTPGQPTPGVIDLFIAYRTEMSRPIALSDDDTVLPTERLDTYLRAVPGGGLFVLPAGKRDDGYSGRITSFDWNEFLKEWEGERFIEHLRQKFNAAADVVLIDTSATITEATRICTSHLADVVVVFCPVGLTSLDSTTSLARQLTDPKLQQKRAPRQIELLVVPARIEYREAELLNDFKKRFIDMFTPFVPKALDANADAFWNLRVPNIPYYEYREALIIQDSDQAIAEPLVDAYVRMINVIDKLGPNVAPDPEPTAAVEVKDPPADALAPFRTLRVRKTETPTVFVSYAREDEAAVRALATQLKAAGFRTWLDKDNLHAGEDWQSVIEKTIEQADFVIICYSSRAVVKRGYVQREIKKTLEIVEFQPEGTVFLIPVRLDECELPRSVSNLHAVDLFDQSGFSRLEESIRYAWRQSRMMRR
jgi:MinD-like ATPase involved in chromosome partitioning or flagellar assembly